MSRAGRAASLTIAVVYPDLLGTYGDGGNGLVLARRAPGGASTSSCSRPSRAGHCRRPTSTASAAARTVPRCGRPRPCARTAPWPGRSAQGAVVLGVCAGFQLLGSSFPDSHDRPHDGLGLLDVTTAKGTGTRAVGEVVAAPVAAGRPG